MEKKDSNGDHIHGFESESQTNRNQHQTSNRVNNSGRSPLKKEKQLTNMISFKTETQRSQIPDSNNDSTLVDNGNLSSLVGNANKSPQRKKRMRKAYFNQIEKDISTNKNVIDYNRTTKNQIRMPIKKQ